MWNTIKDIAGKKEYTIPKRLIHKGEFHTSQKRIANLVNEFFIENIDTIEKGFSEPKLDPLYFLRKVIPKPESTFILPEITLKDTTEIIKNAKNSNTKGFDNISMSLLKINPEIVAIFITHAINTSIRTGIFPECMKVARIVPLLKSNKIKTEVSSYRPICNLHTVEKIYEEHIKRHINLYLEANNIIHESHHGGQNLHSTQTAKAMIDIISEDNIQDNKITAIISTDLSAAYDTINHKILIDKLKFYGFKGKDLALMKSYLNERKQYTEIETFKYEVTNAV